MTFQTDTHLPTRRKRRGPAIMVWLFLGLAAGVTGVFMLQASGFDIEEFATPAKPAAPVATKKQAAEQERFAVQGSEVAGFDEDEQPYKIAAVQASQDKDQPNLVHMRQVTGLLRRADGRAMDISARAGLFNSKSKSLRLTGEVTIRLADAFTATMELADVDVKRKALQSDVDVVVVLDGGQITSTGIDVADNGTHVTFRTNVHAVFDSTDTTSGSPAGPTANATSTKGNLQQ
jgi:hypothetical protein